MSVSEDEASQDSGVRSAWAVVTEHVDDITAALQVSLHALDSEVNPEKRLEKAQAGVEELKQNLTTLQASGKKLQTDLDVNKHEQELQQASLTKCRHQNAMLHDRIQDLEAVIQEHEQASEDATGKLNEDEAHRRTLQQTIESLNADIGRLKSRAQAAEQSMAGMAKQHNEAMAEMNEKTAAASEACEQLDDAKHRASQAESSAEKALQYVAKLSADNVVLMVKLKKAESRRDALAAESAELRAAVDTQSGPWFEEVHAAVEASQRESMKRADTLQAKLRQQEEQAEKQRAEAQAERDRLSQHLGTALDSVKELEESLQASRKEAKELRVQIKRQAEDLSATATARDEAAACARVVGEERAQMKREWSEMYAAHEGLQQRISSLQRQVAEECSVAQADRTALARAQQQLQVERSVNRKLLESKADVEYRLMEALSQHPGTEVPTYEPPLGGADARGPPRVTAAGLAPPPASEGHSRDMHASGGSASGSPVPKLHLQHTQRHSEGSGGSLRMQGAGGTFRAPAAHSSPGIKLPIPGGEILRHAERAAEAVPHSGMSQDGVAWAGGAGGGDGEAYAAPAPASERVSAAAVMTAVSVSRSRTPLQPLEDPGSGCGSPADSARTARSGAVTARHSGMRPAEGGEGDDSGRLPGGGHVVHAADDGAPATSASEADAAAVAAQGVFGPQPDHGGLISEQTFSPAGVMHAWAESRMGGDGYGDSGELAAEEWEKEEGADEWYDDGYERAGGEQVQRHKWYGSSVPLSGCEAVSAAADYTPRPHIPHARSARGRGGIRGGSVGVATGEQEDRDMAAVQRERGGTDGGVGSAAGGEEDSRRGDSDSLRLAQELRWSVVAGGSVDLDGSAANAGVDAEVAGAMRHRLALDLDDIGHSSSHSSSLKYLPYGQPIRGSTVVSGVSFGQENENQNSAR